MPIVTDQTITIHGVEVGISKPIQTLIADGDFTYEELSKFAFVGRYDFVNDKCGGYATAGAAYGDSQTLITEGKFPVLNDPTANWDSVKYVYTGIGERQNDNYGKMVLVYNRVNSANNINRQYNDDNTACIVTEINPRLLKVICPIYQATVEATKGTPGTYTVYEPESSINIVWYDDDSAAPFSTLCCQKFTDVSYFVFPLYNNVFYAQQNINGNRSGTGAEVAFMYDSFELLGDHNFSSWAASDVTDIFMQDADYSAGFVGAMDLSDDRGDKLLTVNYNPYSAEIKVRASSLDTALKQCAAQGLYFEYDNTVYKPITDGGIVTGYTADLSKNSEWDLINDVTGNTVPDTPSGGGGGDDDDDSDWDDIPINGAGIGGGSAFCRFYYCTEAELANLRTWTMGLSQSGDPIPGGFDPKSNIIGLTVFPFTVSGNGPTTIKFTTNGGQDPVTQQPMPRVVDSGVSCEGGAGATTRILNATIDVPATMKSRGEPWLDYESYIELYIPMCGVYQVDPQVCIGRTIHVEIFLDPVSGTIMGIAWVPKNSGKCIIAQGSGTPGVQIPVAVGNYGLAQAARVQNTLGAFSNTANSSISTTMVSNAFQNRAGDRSLNGVRKVSQNASAGSRVAAFNRSGSAILGFSGLVSSAQHWVSARQIANSPGTSASGGFSGSMAEWCGVFKPYVKIVRPKFRKPSNYKHTCGEPEVTTRGLNSTGYAVCINPDVSGLTNATEAERAAVYQYLSTGVYYK